MEAVFRARAQALAQRRVEAATGLTLPVLVFTLAGERFALELIHLAEVLVLERWARVPGAPPEIVGAINRRGDIRLVADLGRLLGLEEKPPAGRPVLMLRAPEMGWLVESVERIHQIPSTDPVWSGEKREGALRGITADGLRLVSVEAVQRHPALASSEEKEG